MHQLVIVVQVVQRAELRAENLANAVEVVQVGARKVLAGIAVAAVVERLRVCLVLAFLIRTSPWRVKK
jgi:hypothetical protein